MKIGSAHIAAALDEAVIGMKPGEARTVSVTFPEDHANEKLKGQEIAFNITLKEIRKRFFPRSTMISQKISESSKPWKT